MPKVIYTRFVVGVAEILIQELMLERSTGRQVAMTINYKIKNNVSSDY